MPIGQTDILISFVYKLAFTPSSAADYGLGAAIPVALFLVVGTVTIFQIRATRAFEDRSSEPNGSAQPAQLVVALPARGR